MGTTYRFVAAPSPKSEVVEWFAALELRPKAIPKPEGFLLHFDRLGALALNAAGAVDPAGSPVVNVFLPQVRRGILWTVGEVHFVATPLKKQFPYLQKVSGAFASWLGTYPRIFPASKDAAYDYFLEGSLRNFDSPIFALPSGLAAIRDGRYFVAEGDNPARLETLCKELRLRGCRCTT